MAYISKRTGKEVDELLDKVESGGTGGEGNSDNNYTDADKALVQTIPNKVDQNAFNDIVENVERNIESLGEHISEVGEYLVETKADKDEYYPDMSVGMADNLVGRGDVQDAQINFRPSAGADNITDGAARIKKIKGNSVVYNQLLQNADFRNGTSGWINNNTTLTMNDDGSMRITNNLGNSQGINQNIAIPANRKILIIADFRRSSLTESQFVVYMHKADGYDMSHSSAYSDVTRTKKTLIIESTTIIDQILIYPFITGEVGSYTDIYSCVAIDLTKEFGAGNEPTTVDEYYQRKPMNIEDEFAYNECELIDMKVDSLVSVSDNAFDYTKGYARVMGGYKYDITANAGATLVVSFYADGEDSNEEREIAPDSEGKYTFPANGICYVNGDFANGSNVCVCLNHSYDKPHPAYQQEVKDLSFISEAFSNGMRSAGSVFDEIRFNPTKKVWEKVTRIGVIDLGKAQWYIDTSLGGFYAGNISPVPQRMFQGRCAKYPFKGAYSNVKDGESGWVYNTGFFVKDSNYTDAASLKASLDGVLLYYELAEPIVVELDYPTAETNMDYLVWDFGTEEAIVPNNVPSAPFRADINYEPNAVDDLRWAVSEIRSLKAQLAQMSASVTNLSE